MSNIVAARPSPGSPVESTWGGEIHDALEGIGRGGRYQGGTLSLSTTAKKFGLSTVLAGEAAFLDAPNAVLSPPDPAAKGIYLFIAELLIASPGSAVVNIEVRRNGASAAELGSGVYPASDHSNGHICISGMHFFDDTVNLEIWGNLSSGTCNARALVVHFIKIANDYTT